MHSNEPVNRFMNEPVVSIEIGSPAAEILRLFGLHPFHHLPVVDKTKVVGMLSSADVLKLDAFLPKRGGVSPDYLSRRVRIDQLMRKPPITVGPHQSVEHAATLMAEHGVHALPVVDSADVLLGIITTTDIMYAVLHRDRRGSEGNTAGAGAPAPIELSPAQLNEAAHLAAKAANSDDDDGKLARALLHAQSRLKVLENVLTSADRYVHAGQDERLHTILVKALTKAKESSGPTPALGL